MTNALKGISIIIPAYNEERSVADVARRIHAVCSGLGTSWEIIVVDDGSSDGTGDAAKNAGAIVLRNPANGGYGISLRRGILAAQHDVVAITDADGTYPVEEIPKLFAEMKNGFDMVVGARQGSVYEGSMIKSWSRKAFRWLAEYTAGRKIPDINSGLRLFRRDLAVKHLPQTCFGFSFTTSLTLIFMLQGYFVGYVPIVYHARVGKTKVRHVRDALRTLQIMTEIIIQYNPIKLFLLYAIGLVLLAVAAWVVGWFLYSFVLQAVGFAFFTIAPILIGMGFLAYRRPENL